MGARRFLIFLGDEILLGWSPTLVSAGRYRVHIVRGQFGAVRRTHALGAECWCVQLGDQPVFEWDAPKWALAVGLKVQPRMLHVEAGLADVAKITHPILLRALRPLGPANLTANGDGVAPTYATGQNVVLDWDLFASGQGRVLATDVSGLDLAIRSFGDSLGDPLPASVTGENATVVPEPVVSGLVLALGAIAWAGMRWTRGR